MSAISHLPSDVIELIFSHLSYSDLGSAMRVCQKWCEVGCQPLMWREFPLVVNFNKNLEEFELCLKGKRFSFVRRFKLVDNFVRDLCLTGNDVRHQIKTMDRTVPESILSQHRADESRRKKFQLIWQLPRLESLDLSEYNISSIDPDFLTDFPLNIKSLTMNGVKQSNTGLTPGQAQALFDGLKNQEKLTELKISEDDLKDVDKDLFASVINKLENVELRFSSRDFGQINAENVELLTSLHFGQFEALIGVMEAQDTKLRKLSIYDGLYHVDEKKLSNALNKVESVYLYDFIGVEVFEMLLKQIIIDKTCLKSLRINFCEAFDYDDAVEDIPEDLISEAGKKLDSFILSCPLHLNCLIEHVNTDDESEQSE